MHHADTTASPPEYLSGMNRAQFLALCEQAGAKPLHAQRLTAHIHRHGITDIAEIPELPAQLRALLAVYPADVPVSRITEQVSEDGTRKMLLRLPDGRDVETVWIPGKGRTTQCISTQVGCAVGCTFCLTATAGLTRNLSAAEMVAQVEAVRSATGQRARNLVLMGMGEPLHNYEAVAHFVHLATDPLGLAFSPNRITLSTAGLVPGIRRMIEEELPCNLAVSLNATTDAVRSEIMPINRKYPLSELLAAIRDYVRIRGGKRVLIEYVMLAGINDSPADARRLVELMHGLDCTVNLLPFNAFPGSAYARPDENVVDAFRTILSEAGFVAVVRESRGRDISAACGQLKTEIMQRRRV
jgi:23S rRNA (adenine2503-C2)-methyltransferase